MSLKRHSDSEDHLVLGEPLSKKKRLCSVVTLESVQKESDQPGMATSDEGDHGSVPGGMATSVGDTERDQLLSPARFVSGDQLAAV